MKQILTAVFITIIMIVVMRPAPHIFKTYSGVSNGRLDTQMVQSAKPLAKTIVEANFAPQIQLPNITCSKYADDFEKYNWDVYTALAICQAESRGNPNAISNADINYDHVPDYGLMQLHGVNVLDPAANVAYAYYHKYLTQGWSAWSTYLSGAYSQYL